MANPTAGRPADLGVRRDLRVLIVDDQSEIHDDFRESLGRDAGMASDEAAASFGVPTTRSKLPAIELLHANDGESACALLEGLCQAGRQVAVAYVDIRMPPGIDGAETVRRMRSIDSDIEIVIMTAYTDKPLRDIVSGMTSLHKLLYIRKPFAPEEVQQITTALALKWSLERDLVASRRRLDEEEQRLRAVLDATGDAVALYDDASLVFANRSYEALFGMSFAELCGLSRNAAGKRFKDVFPSSSLPAVSGTAAAAGEMRAGFVELVSAPSASEEGQVFHRSWRPVRDGKSDRVIGDLVVYRDVSDGVENERMRAEVQRLRSQVEDVFAVNGIVGSSAEMQEVRELLQRAVETDVTVLVKGESGTGKELVARAMHFNSRRRKGPFVAVNVSAIPETLIESELFGHERGAFTGAIGRRIGCFEEAEGGTLLLDEIGDIPVQLQSKLLRVLQERQIRRVGGGTSVPVDVRIVAATNSDLEARMRDGTFREDLYYRLAVFPITLPPLRTRGGDILLLAGHFLKKHADRMGRSVHGISVSAARLLTRYRWPGNVRELENVICRGLVLETTDVLQSDRLPPEIAAVTDEASPPPASSLEEAEKQAIARALEASSCNLTRAARILDIDRSTLHRKLKKHGLALPAVKPARPGVPQPRRS